MNINSKNGRKWYFSYQTKPWISFIPIRRMRLWCLIMKRKEIIMWIHVCRNQPMNINSEKGRKRSFSYEIKASIAFIPTMIIYLWCLITKGMEIILWICVSPNRWTNINSKSGRKKCFSYEIKAWISFITVRRMCL